MIIRQITTHCKNLALFVFAIEFLSSCASTPASMPKHIEKIDFDETKLTESAKISYSEGSLWPQDDAGFNIFSDKKAAKIGDIVTIIVDENAQANKTATTKLSKNSSIESDVSSLLGFEKAIQLKNPNFNPKALFGTSHKDDFDGSGTTTRSGDLKTTITAKVIKVYPNANLLISASREITLNEEDQIMVLTGIIRPEDIAADNTINSAKIADAKITYTGKGVIAEKQHPGWMTRLLAWIWPF